jgi:quercetin dioxygenase-like cupin family protein
MRMIRFDGAVARQLGPTFSGVGVLRDENINVGVLHVAAGGEIPRHPATVDQLLMVVSGSGEVCGEDGEWRPIRAGQGAVWAGGEQHTTRADEQLTALVIELAGLPVHPRAVPLEP